MAEEAPAAEAAEEEEEDFGDELEFVMGKPLVSPQGVELKVTGGDRKGAQLYTSITISKKGEEKSEQEYSLESDCYVEVRLTPQPLPLPRPLR